MRQLVCCCWLLSTSFELRVCAFLIYYIRHLVWIRFSCACNIAIILPKFVCTFRGVNEKRARNRKSKSRLVSCNAVSYATVWTFTVIVWNASSCSLRFGFFFKFLFFSVLVVVIFFFCTCDTVIRSYCYVRLHFIHSCRWRFFFLFLFLFLFLLLLFSVFLFDICTIADFFDGIFYLCYYYCYGYCFWIA